jgi:hypothetical protein
MTPETHKTRLNERLDEIASLIAERDLNDRDLISVAHYWLEKIKLFSLFTKHPGFDEERE